MIIEEESSLKDEIRKLKENIKIKKLKEQCSEEEIKSILNFVMDSTYKFILQKILLGDDK